VNGEAIMNTERELTINELDAVAGGSIKFNEFVIKKTSDSPGGDGGGGGGPSASGAWNTLLHNYGFA
jgi:hypothetical protein